MKQLFRFSTKKLRYAEAGEFIKKTHDDVITAGLDLTKDLRIKGYMTQMQQNVEEWDGRILVSSKSTDTELLETLDGDRDHVFMALSTQYLVHSYEKNDLAIINAFKALSTIFPMYDGVSRQNYAAETASIRSLIKDLKNPTNAASVTVLRLDYFVQKLDAANEAFSTAFANRDVKESAKEPIIDNRNFRAGMFQNYDDFAGYTLYMAKDEKHPEAIFYNRLLEIINYVRRYFYDMIATREGRNNKNNLSLGQ